MSALIAYIDFANNRIRYQNAGYMDPVCIDSETGRFEDVNPEKKGALPLGIIRDTVYAGEDDVEFHFKDTSVFLFCSDGLIGLSKEKDGSSHMDMKTFLDLASLLISDGQKKDKSIAIPFQICHTLRQFGYNFPQDDISVALIRKTLRNEREYSFSCRVPADRNAVDGICQKASDFVTRHYGGDEISVNTDLLLAEYLVNVILHGLNEYEKLNDYIAIKLCASETELKVIVWDHGKEWNGFLPRQDSADERLEQLNRDMATSGRGLPIISKIASQISRQRYCGLNESVFIIPVPGNVSGPAENEIRGQEKRPIKNKKVSTNRKAS